MFVFFHVAAVNVRIVSLLHVHLDDDIETISLAEVSRGQPNDFPEEVC